MEKLRCCAVSLESFSPHVPRCYMGRNRNLLHRIQAKGSNLSPAAALMSAPTQVSLLTPLTSAIINVNYTFLSGPPTHFFQEKPFVSLHLELILTSCILSTEPTSCPAASSQTPLDAILPLLKAWAHVFSGWPKWKNSSFEFSQVWCFSALFPIPRETRCSSRVWHPAKRGCFKKSQ